MNDQFKEHAIAVIDNMSKEELKTGLKAAGIETVSKYSGLPLSEVPYADIFVGMEVISAVDTPGKVISQLDVEKSEDPEDDNWIEISWNNGKTSYDNHYLFDKVKVK